jgi:acyl-CoA thioesterase
MTTFGIELVAATSTRAEVRMAVDVGSCNGFGVLHGGLSFLLADTAMAFASNADEAEALAASGSIDFLLPVAVGDTVTAVAERRWSNGRTAMWDVTVTNRAGETVALFRGTTTRRRPPAAT